MAGDLPFIIGKRRFETAQTKILWPLSQFPQRARKKKWRKNFRATTNAHTLCKTLLMKKDILSLFKVCLPVANTHFPVAKIKLRIRKVLSPSYGTCATFSPPCFVPLNSNRKKCASTSINFPAPYYIHKQYIWTLHMHLIVQHMFISRFFFKKNRDTWSVLFSVQRHSSILLDVILLYKY